MKTSKIRLTSVAAEERNGSDKASAAVPDAMNAFLADLFALYVKVKGFHWHVSGPHFRDYHLLLDDQADQILQTVDAVAERVRKLDSPTLRSIRDVAERQRIADTTRAVANAKDMLGELLNDNRELVMQLKKTHELCDEQGDVATASLIENWIDEADQRAWFLKEAIS